MADKNQNPKRALESLRASFFVIGLVAALALTLFVLQVSMPAQDQMALNDTSAPVIEDDRDVPVVVLTPSQPMEKVERQSEAKQSSDEMKRTELSLENYDPDLGGEEYEWSPIELVPEVFGDEKIAVDVISLDRLPIYEGCEAISDKKEQEKCLVSSLQRVIQSKLQFTEWEKQTLQTSMIYIDFVITRDGGVDEVNVLRAPTANIEMQLKRIVAELPKFTPGLLGGRTRAARLTLPLRYVFN